MAEAPPSGEVTVLLQRFRAGDSSAEENLIPLLVNELRSLARKELRRERPGHTLQPSAMPNCSPRRSDDSLSPRCLQFVVDELLKCSLGLSARKGNSVDEEAWRR